MKVTTDNWKEMWRDMKEAGLLETIHDDNGRLQTVITKKGTRYEFSPEVIKVLIESGEIHVRLGRKTATR